MANELSIRSYEPTDRRSIILILIDVFCVKISLVWHLAAECCAEFRTVKEMGDLKKKNNSFPELNSFIGISERNSIESYSSSWLTAIQSHAKWLSNWASWKEMNAKTSSHHPFQRFGTMNSTFSVMCGRHRMTSLIWLRLKGQRRKAIRIKCAYVKSLLRIDTHSKRPITNDFVQYFVFLCRAMFNSIAMGEANVEQTREESVFHFVYLCVRNGREKQISF